jgi:hypothetical protein
MSVIMQQGLASLLIRRTDEARAKAQQRMEAWQAAIAAVQQAEKIAECKINLLAEQIEIAQRAAVKVRTANYILAVHLDKKATTERNAVIAIATEALQAEIKHRQWQETMAKQELQSAISEREYYYSSRKGTSITYYSGRKGT